MQITMENKKKQMVYIAIIVVSFGVTAWLVFGSLFGGGEDTADLVTQHLSPSSGDSVSGQSPAVGTPSSATLPYGTSFDFSIFSDERFLELVGQPKLQVSPSELGKNNAFIP